MDTVTKEYQPPKIVPKGLKRCAAEGCMFLALTPGDYCVRHQDQARGG